MSAKQKDDTLDSADRGAPEERPTQAGRLPYEPPRIEKRRSVARVTLLSNMGQMGVGVIMR